MLVQELNSNHGHHGSRVCWGTGKTTEQIKR